MKIAAAGKGGVGKTTIAGTLARMLADDGQTVMVIDGDADANLASAMGCDPEAVEIQVRGQIRMART
jgi:CO dehydrogenase maturation factor